MADEKTAFEEHSTRQSDVIRKLEKERDTYQHKFEMVQETLNTLENVKEKIKFTTIHATPNKAVARHKQLNHFDKVFGDGRQRQSDAPTDLYEPNKKIRHSPYVNMTDLSKKNAAELTQLVNTRGLISPVYFDVKEAGIISLTDIASRHADVTYKYKTYGEVAALWRDEKAPESSRKLQKLLKDYGLWTQGHRPNKGFPDALHEEGIVSPRNIYEVHPEVMKAVEKPLTAFDTALASPAGHQKI
ncbi:hypothetical protein ACHAPU_001735 [Fusarium lateritium]